MAGKPAAQRRWDYYALPTLGGERSAPSGISGRH
jgi:uncharacterized protein YcaQ